MLKKTFFVPVFVYSLGRDALLVNIVWHQPYFFINYTVYEIQNHRVEKVALQLVVYCLLVVYERRNSIHKTLYLVTIVIKYTFTSRKVRDLKPSSLISSFSHWSYLLVLLILPTSCSTPFYLNLFSAFWLHRSSLHTQTLLYLSRRSSKRWCKYGSADYKSRASHIVHAAGANVRRE